MSEKEEGKNLLATFICLTVAIVVLAVATDFWLGMNFSSTSSPMTFETAFLTGFAFA